MIENKVANKDSCSKTKTDDKTFFYIQKSDFNVLLRSVNLVHREKNVIRNQRVIQKLHIHPFSLNTADVKHREFHFVSGQADRLSGQQILINRSISQQHRCCLPSVCSSIKHVVRAEKLRVEKYTK